MIQIELRPELEAQIAAQAQARGLALEQYIVEKLEASSTIDASGRQAVGDAIERLTELRKGNFLGGANIKDLINEGRKY